jgi:hypothetical protein
MASGVRERVNRPLGVERLRDTVGVEAEDDGDGDGDGDRDGNGDGRDNDAKW